MLPATALMSHEHTSQELAMQLTSSCCGMSCMYSFLGHCSVLLWAQGRGQEHVLLESSLCSQSHTHKISPWFT